MIGRAEAMAALAACDGRLRGALQFLIREGDEDAIGHVVARRMDAPSHEAGHLLDLALLASGTRRAIETLLFASSTLLRRDPVLRGLAFADGAPGTPFEPNPWEIRADASFHRALATIWAPVASPTRAAEAVVALQREVFAVALVEFDEPREQAVGYFHPWRRLRYEIEEDGLPPLPELLARREALDWADHAGVGLFFGFAPNRQGSRFSRAMGEFCRVHDGMEDGLLWINRQNRMSTLDRIFEALKTPAGVQFFRANNGGRAPDEFVDIFCLGDDAEDVFDLASHDDSGDPMVCRWYGQGMDLLDERTVFWRWLETTIPRSFLKLAPEEEEELRPAAR